MDQDKYLQFRQFIQITTDYIKVVNELVRGIEDLTHEAYAELTKQASGLGEFGRDRRREIDDAINKAYIAPGAEAEQQIKKVQDKVDRLIDNVQAGEGEPEESSQDYAARVGGSLVAKHLEATSFLEERIANVLFKFMGTLSTDDVVVQGINNLSISTNENISFLSQFLSRNIIDFSNNDVNSWQLYLLNSVTSRTKTQEETRIFDKYQFKGKDTLNGNNDLFSFIKASEVLVFQARFCNSIADQITELSALIVDSVQDSIENIYTIDASNTELKDHGVTKVKKSGDKQEFAKIVERDSAETVDEAEKAGVQDLKQSLDLLENFSEKVSNEIFTMMGTLSMGDVAFQRLTAAADIGRYLAKVLESIASGIQPALTQPYVNDVKKACYQCSISFFKTEDDKKIFRKVIDNSPSKVA